MIIKKIKNIIIIITCITFFCNCTKNTKKQFIKYKLEIVDSIIIPYQRDIIYTDYNNNLDLHVGYNAYNGEILLFNSKGDLRTINKRGLGPNEYSEIIQLGFFNDSTLINIGSWEVYLINLRTEAVKKVNLDFAVQHYTMMRPEPSMQPAFFINPNGDTVILYHKDYRINEGDLDKETKMNMVNLTKKLFLPIFSFSKNSIYAKSRKKGIRYISSYLITSKILSNKFFYMHGDENKVYAYEISFDKIKLTDEIDFFATHFYEPTGFPIEMLNDMEEFQKLNVKLSQNNSCNSGIFNADSLVFVTFQAGVKENDRIAASFKEYNEKEFSKYHPNYCIIIKNNKQISDEIELTYHSHNLYLTYANNMDYLILKAFFNKEDEFQKFYIGKFIKIDK